MVALGQQRCARRSVCLTGVDRAKKSYISSPPRHLLNGNTSVCAFESYHTVRQTHVPIWRTHTHTPSLSVYSSCTLRGVATAPHTDLDAHTANFSHSTFHRWNYGKLLNKVTHFSVLHVLFLRSRVEGLTCDPKGQKWRQVPVFSRCSWWGKCYISLYWLLASRDIVEMIMYRPLKTVNVQASRKSGIGLDLDHYNNKNDYWTNTLSTTTMSSRLLSVRILFFVCCLGVLG